MSSSSDEISAIDRLLDQLCSIYADVARRRAVCENVSEDCRALLKPWPKKHCVTATKDDESTKTATDTEVSKVSQQELAELSLVDRAIARAQRARNMYQQHKVENEVKYEDKHQITKTNVVSSQKRVSKVSSDSQPSLPSRSGVHCSKSTSRSSSQGLKEATDSAVLQERNADVATKTITGKSVPAGKKPTVRYKPAHHSAPFKTMPLPPGRSKLPPMSSRKASASSRGMEGREIVRHGGQITGSSSAASQAVERRRLVRDEGQRSVTSSASGVTSSLPFSGGRNSSDSVASVADGCHSQTTGLCNTGSDSGSALDTARGLQAELVSDCGISDSGGIPGDSVTGLAEDDAGQIGRAMRPNDGRTFVSASAVVSRQSESTSVGGMTTNDVTRRPEAVDQSATAIQQAASLSQSQQSVAENLASSFILHRDGRSLKLPVGLKKSAAFNRSLRDKVLRAYSASRRMKLRDGESCAENFITRLNVAKTADDADVDALSLHLQVEEVVADGVEFIEFEADLAYCQCNKCETESEEFVAGVSRL